MRSLVLVGHGSHLNGDSASAVYRYAELLRQRGLFGEVIESYWKEEPSLRQVLRTTSSTDVTVIPMFISEGYFTETVIPRELGLGHQGPVPPGGIARVIGGHTVRYTLPYGVHPAMQQVILERAREALPEFSAQDTALIVLGHGTTRNENSNRVIHQNAAALRELGLFAEVHALFLDEEPKVTDWASRIQAPRIIVVPFFASEGWHTQETIPEDLNLSGQQTTFTATPHAPQTIYYAGPVGTHPAVAQVIFQIAEEASQQSSGGDLDHTLVEAWNTLGERASQGLRVGEVLIVPHGNLYELRHVLDEGRAANELTTYVTPEGLRDRIRFDDSGTYRPVRTFRNMPRHWRAVVGAHDLRRVLQYVYPAAVEETHAYTCRTLHFTPWPTTARRQTGLYARVQKVSSAQVEQVAATVCSQCLRSRLWAAEPLTRTFLEGVPGGLPCAEACTYLVAAVRDWQKQRKQEAGT